LQLLSGKSIKVKVKKQTYELFPEELEVRMQAKEGFVVYSEGAYMAALVAEINQELAYEGLAREFVRRVQDARKQAGLDVADRIKVAYTCSEKLGKAINTHNEYIKAETLALELNGEGLPQRLPNASDEFDGEQVTLWIEKL